MCCRRSEQYFNVIIFRDTPTYLFPFSEIIGMTESEFEIGNDLLEDHYVLALRYQNRKIQDLQSSPKEVEFHDDEIYESEI